MIVDLDSHVLGRGHQRALLDDSIHLQAQQSLILHHSPLYAKL